MNFHGKVETYGANAQTGGSREEYHGKVDRSQGKTKYGDNAQVGGARITNTNSKLIHLKKKNKNKQIKMRSKSECFFFFFLVAGSNIWIRSYISVLFISLFIEQKRNKTTV